MKWLVPFAMSLTVVAGALSLQPEVAAAASGAAYQTEPSTRGDASQTADEGINAAGWGTLIWMGVIAFVAVVLIAVAGLGLRSRNLRE